jgi:hypothetical protein
MENLFRHQNERIRLYGERLRKPWEGANNKGKLKEKRGNIILHSNPLAEKLKPLEDKLNLIHEQLHKVRMMPGIPYPYSEKAQEMTSLYRQAELIEAEIRGVKRTMQILSKTMSCDKVYGGVVVNNRGRKPPPVPPSCVRSNEKIRKLATSILDASIKIEYKFRNWYNTYYQKQIEKSRERFRARENEGEKNFIKMVREHSKRHFLKRSGIEKIKTELARKKELRNKFIKVVNNARAKRDAEIKAIKNNSMKVLEQIKSKNFKLKKVSSPSIIEQKRLQKWKDPRLWMSRRTKPAVSKSHRIAVSRKLPVSHRIRAK